MAAADATQIYNLARGLGEARVKNSQAVQELVALAGGRREPLEEALQQARAAVKAQEATPDPATDKSGPPQAPALLASRLLEEALALVDR